MQRWRDQRYLAACEAGHRQGSVGPMYPPTSRRRLSRAVRPSVLTLGLVAVVLVAAGCREAPTETPVGGLPSVPPPAGAVLDVGGVVSGGDADRAFVAYRSTDPPDVVGPRYEAELARAGWILVRRTGTWRVFRGPGGVVSVSISSAGPPTYVIVQAGSIDGGVAGGTLSSGDPTTRPSSALGTPEPPSRRLSTPPGQASTPPGQASTPPGQASTPPGQASTPPGQASTPPGQASTPPGQASTPPGQASTPPGQASTPPGQASTPPGHGGTPPGQNDSKGRGPK